MRWCCLYHVVPCYCFLWLFYNSWVYEGDEVTFADKHVFLVLLNISLLGGAHAMLHMATFGMSDWKLRPSHVPAD